MTRAHLALCAAAILRRAATDKVRFAVAVPLDFALLFVWDCVRTFAHRALWAAAMRRRATAETTRPDRALVRTVLDPFLPIKSSSTEIAEPNFSTCHCVRSRTLLVAAGAHPLS